MSFETKVDAVAAMPHGLHGKKFDVVLTEQDRGGRETSTLMTGTGRWHAGKFTIYCGTTQPEIPIPLEALAEVTPAPRAVRSLMEGADFMLQLRVRPTAEVC